MSPIALFAIAFSVMMSFAALTADFSTVYLNRRLLQNSVDAAVMAAAPELPGSTANAITQACDYGTTTSKNKVPGMFGKTGACGGLLDVVFSNSGIANDTIQATAYKTIHPTFGSIVGWSDFEVSATAKAKVGSAAATCPFPIFLTEDILPPGTYPDKVQFFGLVKIEFKGDAIDVGNGANGVEEGMYGENCGNDVSIGGSVTNKPGNMTGPLLRGFEWRIYCAGGTSSKPNNSPACPSGLPQASTCPDSSLTSYLQTIGGVKQLKAEINRGTCTRLVIAPVLDGTASQYDTGKQSGKVLGFAFFYIGGVCLNNKCNTSPVGALNKGDSWGYYIRAAFASDVYTNYDGYGTKVVVLSN
jgi:hypothetical protein